MTIEHKSFALAIKADGDDRTVEGLGAVFGNVDAGNDLILPGAFAKSLTRLKAANDNPRMLWQHKTDLPIGVWDEVSETGEGLVMKGRIFDTALGMDAYKLVKGGAIKGLSIGYGVKDFDVDKKKGTRLLKELDLYEVSLVTFPMNDKANITRVKGRDMTLREFEEHLREGGFSQKDATTVALHGFKALTQGEPDELLTKLAERLDRFAAHINPTK